MHKYLLITAIIFGLVSCKTTLIINDIKAENIPNNENISTVDISIINMLAPYKEPLDVDMQQIIGISDVAMTKARPESNLTNYIADLLMTEGKLFAAKHNLKPFPNIAYFNYGGLRSGLPKGEITVGDIFELSPFENEIVLIKISGNKLFEFAEQIAKQGGDCVGDILLGIKDQQVSTLLIGGKPINYSAYYWVITNDYVASGGDNMSMFLEPENYIKTGITCRDFIIDHMKKEYQAGNTISPKMDGRIFNE